jgi:alpha-1,2-mannosyltransferase
VLWILASVAIALLCYEIPTLVSAVLLPLWGNPNVLQTDFHYYYAAAQRFSADAGQLYFAGDHVIAGYAYPPPAILPFVLLAKLPLGPALLLTTVASYAALLVAALQWARHLGGQGITADRKSLVAIVLIVLALGPSYMNAMFGQVNAFVLASAVAFVVLAEVMPLVAGVALALGAWLKLYPALMVWVGTWDRTAWRAIGWAAVAVILIGAGSLLWIPADAYQMFATFVVPSRSGTTAIHITNQSLPAFLERFRYEPNLFLNWTGQQAVAISRVTGAVNVGLFGGVLLLLWKTARSPRRTAHAVAALMAMVAISAPLGWGHTYVMVLPLVMLQLITMTRAPAASAALIFCCVAALMVPAGRHLPLDFAPGWLQNLVYSRYLIATIALILISSASAGRVEGN